MLGRFALLAVLIAGLCALAVPARAATGCAYDADTGVVTVTAGPGPVTIGRGGDAVLVDGAACGDATVTTTERIDIKAASFQTTTRIELGGGPLAPGRTDEPGTSDEIELRLVTGSGPKIEIVGSGGRDHIVYGQMGFNLNADEAAPDLDFDLQGFFPATVSIDGAEGADELASNGGVGTGVSAGYGFTTLSGGNGADTLDGGSPYYGETLKGGDGADTITDADGDAFAYGGAGDDEVTGVMWVAPGPGNDTIASGARTVTVAFPDAASGVTADLALGLVADDGDGGADTLDAGVRNLYGSQYGDVLLGDENDNTLSGGDGPDDLVGRAGKDDLYSGDGDDDLAGGTGDDRLLDDKGNDTLDGGADDDLLTDERGTDGFDGGSGRDRIGLYGLQEKVTIDLAAGAITREAEPVEDLAGVEDVSLDQGASRGGDEVLGDDGPNAIYAPAARIVGRGGDDVMTGRVDYSDAAGPLAPAPGGGCRVVVPGEGTDTVGGVLVGSAFADEISGCVTVEAGEGADHVVGSWSSNVLDGGPGNDYLEGLEGRDGSPAARAPTCSTAGRTSTAPTSGRRRAAWWPICRWARQRSTATAARTSSPASRSSAAPPTPTS